MSSSQTSGGQTAVPEPRKGMPSPRLDESTFKQRYRAHFHDPAFRVLDSEIGRIAEVAWQAYSDSRKSPTTRKAGAGYADPDYDLSTDWIAAKAAIDAAQARHDDAGRRPTVLLVNASPRSEHTCPGEMSKSFRLSEVAREVLEREFGLEVNILDLSRTTSEYGRTIHPCKACFSTAAALCHWPCSCYPNHSLGQIHDWMNDIYPMWAEASAVMIVTPVNWYQATSPLKLMIDRLVCADGGNSDPTSTDGKDAKKGKALELAGWDYPRHLEGRLFSVVVHGDTEGVEGLRRSLSDWLRSVKLVPAGTNAELDRYIGYWKPYATSHEELDADMDMLEEVRIAARTVGEAVAARRAGKLTFPGAEMETPRQK